MTQDDPRQIRRLSPTDVAALIEQAARGEAAVAIVDVRENYEYEGGHLPNSIHIPVGTLKERLDEVPRDRQLVFICRSGARSMAACQVAIAAGIASPVNLEGGLRAWSRDVDPDLTVL